MGPSGTTEIITPPDEALARNTDPDTSHGAAASLTEVQIQNMERTVLEIIVNSPDGATWYEICEHTTIAIQSISPRFKPLRLKGLITELYDDEGKKIKRPGASHRQQIVWFATPLGVVLRKEEPNAS